MTVAVDYTHRPKLITAHELLVVPGAHLKWYDIAEAGHEITTRQRTEAREFVTAQAHSGGLSFAGELGFVILHAAGPGELLMVQTWRGNNELWESNWGRAGRGAFERIPMGPHRPTFCVWEMGVVCGEQRAWTRYLYSARDDAARTAYLADITTGEVSVQV
jgi:hypothetical protein